MTTDTLTKVDVRAVLTQQGFTLKTDEGNYFNAFERLWQYPHPQDPTVTLMGYVQTDQYSREFLQMWVFRNDSPVNDLGNPLNIALGFDHVNDEQLLAALVQATVTRFSTLTV